jgi:hypothetical protein
MFESEPLSSGLTTEPPYEKWALPIGAPYVNEDGTLNTRGTLDRLLATQPGPDVLNVATMLAAYKELLSPEERIDLLIVLERCTSWTDAVKQQVLAAVDSDAGPAAKRSDEPGSREDTVLELALALGWSEWMVHDRLHVAREFAHRLPKTWDALAQGRLNYLQAREIAVGSQKLADPEKVARLEASVLPKINGKTRSEVCQLVNTAVMRLDPEGAEERSQQTRKARRVERFKGEDGEGRLSIRGPAEAIAVMDRAFIEGARRLQDSGQVDTLDQGRFDTALGLCVDYLNDPSVPRRDGAPIGATIVIKGSTVAGADDDPAEVAGFGPITARAARDLLAGRAPAPGPFEKNKAGFAEDDVVRDEDDVEQSLRHGDEPPPDVNDLPPGDWRWEPPPEEESVVRNQGRSDVDPWSIAWRVLKVDPATGWAVPPRGVRMHYGNERRFATPAQARFVRDRDRTCAFPTCSQSGQRLQIDHRIESANGGHTDVENLGPGCPHHNCTTRNRSNWQIKPHGDGTAVLITPQGRRYVIKPHDYLS